MPFLIDIITSIQTSLMLENTVVSHEHAEQVESSEQTSSVSKAEDESQRQPVLCQGKGVTGEIK